MLYKPSKHHYKPLITIPLNALLPRYMGASLLKLRFLFRRQRRYTLCGMLYGLSLPVGTR